jgi:hypothetical protein
VNTADLLVAALRAAGIATGDAQALVGTEQLTGSYAVVWPYPEGAANGPIGAPNADRTVALQITACGPSRKAADVVAEAARAVALALHRGTPPTGYAWQQAPEYVGGQATTRESSLDPATPDTSGWCRADIYRYTITPGAALP